MSSDRDPNRIGVVLTGGTIGATLVDIGPEEIVSLATQSPLDESPEFKLLYEALPTTLTPDLRLRRRVHKLSENIVPKDWPDIASAVRELVSEEKVGGVLVLHGTDTMGYTAAALSFLLADLDVPVVLTGANLPPDHPRSDARKNIHDSVVALQALRAGTYLAFAGGPKRTGWVHAGTCVRKVRATGRAFVSVNREPVGKVDGDSFHWLRQGEQDVATTLPRRRARLPALLGLANHETFDDRVLFFRLYPGINLGAMYSAVSINRMHGVVIELYPAGTGPTAALPKFVDDCVKDKVPVVTTVSQEPSAAANPYESTLEVKKVGGLFLREMLPETAVVKLMWALAQSSDRGRVEELMVTPVAGEFG